MLPSGNDAAHCLAEYFGTLLKQEAHDIEEKERKNKENNKQDDQERGEQREQPFKSFEQYNQDGEDKTTDKEKSNSEEGKITKNYFTGTQIKKSLFVVKHSQFRNYPEVLFFLEEMNKTADRIGLKNTTYDSPHGLSNKQNVSSALDVTKLSTICMQQKKFRDIVGQKFFTVKKNTNGNKRTYKWYNTHLMLGQRGINGVKTGITPNAGPCLCTSIWNDEFELIIVIINTKNMDIRWPETWKLANWAMTRMKTIAKFQ